MWRPLCVSAMLYAVVVEAVMQQRGGIPRTRNITVGTSGQFVQFVQLSMWVHLKTATNPVRLFNSQADFDADANYYEVGTSEVYSVPLEDRGLWMKGVGGNAAVTLTVFHRKG